jgi:hypothetical protein
MHPHGNAKTTGRFVVVTLVLCAAVAQGGQARPPGKAATEALALCTQADQVSVAERLAVLARGLDRAEEAVRADSRDAVAHFAVDQADADYRFLADPGNRTDFWDVLKYVPLDRTGTSL